MATYTSGQTNIRGIDIDKLASVKSTVIIPFKQINDSNLDGTQMILDVASKKI